MGVRSWETIASWILRASPCIRSCICCTTYLRAPSVDSGGAISANFPRIACQLWSCHRVIRPWSWFRPLWRYQWINQQRGIVFSRHLNVEQCMVCRRLCFFKLWPRSYFIRTQLQIVLKIYPIIGVRCVLRTQRASNKLLTNLAARGSVTAECEVEEQRPILCGLT